MFDGSPSSDESGESEAENTAKNQHAKKVKKSNNTIHNMKTHPNHLTLTYGRKTPIMTTRIHPGTKLISENVRKIAEVKAKPVSATPPQTAGRKVFSNHRERFRQQNVSGAFGEL